MEAGTRGGFALAPGFLGWRLALAQLALVSGGRGDVGAQPPGAGSESALAPATRSPLGPCTRAPGPARHPPPGGPSASAVADGWTKPRFPCQQPRFGQRSLHISPCNLVLSPSSRLPAASSGPRRRPSRPPFVPTLSARPGGSPCWALSSALVTQSWSGGVRTPRGGASSLRRGPDAHGGGGSAAGRVHGSRGPAGCCVWGGGRGGEWQVRWEAGLSLARAAGDALPGAGARRLVP